MTDFRLLCVELLAALAWVNKTQPLPEEFGFLDLEKRAAEAIAAPPETGLPLIPEDEFKKAKQNDIDNMRQQQQVFDQFNAAYNPDQYRKHNTPKLPPDASPLVRYQEHQKKLREAAERAKRRIPGAQWY